MWQIGFLDKEQAFFTFARKAKQLYEAALASGEIQPLSQPNQEEVPEIVTMEKEAQFSAFLPAPRTAEVQTETYKVLSVHVVGDFGIARVEWDYGVEEDIFVKKGGSWYLVGTTLIESHGG